MEILDLNIGFANDEAEVNRLSKQFVKYAKRVRSAQLMFYVLMALLFFNYFYYTFQNSEYAFSRQGLVVFITAIFYGGLGFVTNYYPKVSLSIGIFFVLAYFLFSMPTIWYAAIPVVSLLYFGFGLFNAVKMEELGKKPNQFNIEINDEPI